MASESIVLKSVNTQSNPARITYVLDTSVLLADPIALSRFAEHEVIIPITVIGELETKRDHPDLGYFARAALRTLDELRVKSGRLDHPISINDVGGSLSVELNHSDVSKLPAGFLRDGSNDSRILAIAKNLMADGRKVVLVTKDLPLRVKASSVGVEAQEYRAELASSSGWTGMVEESVGSTIIDSLYEKDLLENEIEVGNISGSSLGALQMGSDERIYVADLNKVVLHTIHRPNGLGVQCNFQENGFNLSGGTRSQWGLPNVITDKAISCDRYVYLIPNNRTTYNFDLLVNNVNNVVIPKKLSFTGEIYKYNQTLGEFTNSSLYAFNIPYDNLSGNTCLLYTSDAADE